MTKRSPDMLAKLLQSTTLVTFEQMQGALGDASRATTFRYLKQVPYQRSYNHNGRYYTNPDPTLFDRWGLASHGDVHFSRDGTLGATVKRLVRESTAGWTQRELQALLRHKFPTGDLGTILEHAVAMLHKQVRKQKFAMFEKPRRKVEPKAAGRAIPAAIRRAVGCWAVTPAWLASIRSRATRYFLYEEPDCSEAPTAAKAPE